MYITVEKIRLSYDIYSPGTQKALPIYSRPQGPTLPFKSPTVL